MLLLHMKLCYTAADDTFLQIEGDREKEKQKKVYINSILSHQTKRQNWKEIFVFDISPSLGTNTNIWSDRKREKARTFNSSGMEKSKCNIFVYSFRKFGALWRLSYGLKPLFTFISYTNINILILFTVVVAASAAAVAWHFIHF